MRLRSTALVAVLALAAPAGQDRAPAVDSIREADLRADLFFLASDAMRGRLTDTPENRLAAEFIKARFERLGLAPAVPGYFQPYELVTTSLGDGNALDIVGVEAGTVDPVAHGQAFVTQRFSPTAEARGPVVFAGYGITAPDLGWDDYRSDLVRGAAVLVLDHEPGERDPDSPFDGVVTAHAAGAIQKALAAQARGAAAILFVPDVHNHPGAGGGLEAAARAAWPAAPPRIGRYALGAWIEALRIPAVQVSADVAARLARGTGRTLDALARTADTPGGAPAVRLPGVEVRVRTAVDRQVVPDRNVLALMPGADPRLRDEWVILSAHFDHDGATATQILNGADDDGSGTVGLLEIAEAYAIAAEAGHRPRRSVLFAAFNSEERGLLGAWAYTVRPVAPLDRTVAVLNMDMIGRNEEVPSAGGGGRFNGLEPQTAESNANALNVIGSVRAPDLRTLIDRLNGPAGLEIRYRYDNNVSQLLRRSDHWPFIQHGVPGVWFFTGLHPDYHQAGDRPERINYPKMTRVVRLVYEVSWALATADGRPALLPRGR